MVNTSEIMVGNWVNLHDSETGDSFMQVTVYNIGDGNFFKPILLTPEILTDWCGFDQEFDLFAKDEFYIQEEDADAPGIVSSLRVKVWDRLILVNYLHQLQNWYKLYVGKELEVKIPQKI